MTVTDDRLSGGVEEEEEEEEEEENHAIAHLCPSMHAWEIKERVCAQQWHCHRCCRRLHNTIQLPSLPLLFKQAVPKLSDKK